MPTSVALGTRFETFIRDQVASGRYNNVSEVVRDGLRLLEDKEAERAQRLEALRADIAKGERGPFSPADEAFARIRAKVAEATRKSPTE